MEKIEHTIPLPDIAQGLLLVFDAASAFTLLYLVFAAYQFGHRFFRRGRAADFGGRITGGVCFIALIGFLLYAAHWATTYDLGLNWTIAILGATIFVCGVFLFSPARHLWPEDRVHNAVLLWSIFGISICMLLFFSQWLDKHHGGVKSSWIDAAGYVTTLAQVIGILIAATMVITTNRQNAKQADRTARQQIYQTLEIESIRLFRFEADHRELVEKLWFSTANSKVSQSKKAHTDGYLLNEYVCQMLNLFEMACRCRREAIIDVDIFGSWVIWIWEVCNSKHFKILWCGADKIEFNYVEEFRELINAGLHFSNDAPPNGSTVSAEDRRKSFFNYVADRMTGESDGPYAKNDLMKWLEQTTSDPGRFSKFWQSDQITKLTN